MTKLGSCESAHCYDYDVSANKLGVAFAVWFDLGLAASLSSGEFWSDLSHTGSFSLFDAIKVEREEDKQGEFGLGVMKFSRLRMRIKGMRRRTLMY